MRYLFDEKELKYLTLLSLWFNKSNFFCLSAKIKNSNE